MFCQEAAMKILSGFVKSPGEYLRQTTELGFTTGIEPPAISGELYRPLFTC
jgi:hypothetical protein